MVKKHLLFWIASFVLGFSAFAQVKTISFSALEERINLPESDTTYVINFWATWCGPCVRELPEFKEAHLDQLNEKVKFIFVSLDFPGKEEDVGNFFVEAGMKGEVIMLSDTDANQWINKVKPDWQGNIPVTWFISPFSKKKVFHNGTITTKEINSQINTLKNKK